MLNYLYKRQERNTFFPLGSRMNYETSLHCNLSRLFCFAYSNFQTAFHFLHKHCLRWTVGDWKEKGWESGEEEAVVAEQYNPPQHIFQTSNQDPEPWKVCVQVDLREGNLGDIVWLLKILTFMWFMRTKEQNS